MDYFWDTSGVGHKNSISEEMPLSCRETTPKLSRLNIWFYCFDKFLFKIPHRGNETNIQKLRYLNVLRAPPWMLDQVDPGSRDHHQGADGAPSEKSHVFFVLIKHHLQQSDLLSFRVKL